MQMITNVSDRSQGQFLKALHRKHVNKTPVWFMRQAGRYLPEYQKVRKQAGSFLALCKNPELVCEVTLQPLNRFNLDAAIIFSDILTIPDALGLGLSVQAGKGISFSHPIQSLTAIRALPKIDPSADLAYVMDGIKLTKQALPNNMPLIGFAGSPWTMACYMLQGGSAKKFTNAIALMTENPAALHELLSILSDCVADYLIAQIDAGVDCIMLFDSWGGILPPAAFKEFSLHYSQQIFAKIKASHVKAAPSILFSKDINDLLLLASSGASALSLASNINIGTAREQVGNRVALQGNLDLAVVYQDEKTIIKAVEALINRFGPHPGHIFNLGHGIKPDMDPEKIKLICDVVHDYSARLFANVSC